jgi:hypothetical protein
MTIMTVGKLEEILNNDPNNKARGVQYNFFSNLSSNVQKDLKENIVTVPRYIPDYPNSPETAFLLTDVAALSFSSDIISAEAAIGHNSIAKDNFLYPSIPKIGSSQIRTSEVSTNHISREIGTSQLGVGKVSSNQAGMTKIDFSTIGSSQVGIHKIGLLKRSSTEVGSAQINTHHIGFAQIGVTQVDTTQVNISQFSNIQLSPSEISLPRSIPSEQFFNLHSHNSSSIYTINNSAINLWDDLLKNL